MIVIPGLINAHQHFYYHLFKGLGHGLLLEDWFPHLVFPVLPHLTDDDMELTSYLAGIEMLSTGNDMLSQPPAHHDERGVVEAHRGTDRRDRLPAGDRQGAPVPVARQPTPSAQRRGGDRLCRRTHSTLEERSRRPDPPVPGLRMHVGVCRAEANVGRNADREQEACRPAQPQACRACSRRHACPSTKVTCKSCARPGRPTRKC